MDIVRNRRTKARIAAFATSGALAVAFAGAPAAQAQPDVVIGGGLVNVQVNNVLNDNEVGIGVAAGVAAQVCGLTAQVGVIASQVARTGAFSCENSADGQTVDITQ
jgi:hypothetical protein